MSCSNCFNGCAETTSDKCVKYTGIDIPQLNIVNGDPLTVIEESLSTYLISALNGTGIVPTIDPDVLCALINQYLPISGTITIVNIIEALMQASCDLQSQTTTISNSVATLNANYSVDCLTGVTNSSDTHDILQAVITKVCSLQSSLTALQLEVDTNYVKIADLDGYIAAYLASHP
jgi:hypothetical protein